MKVQSIGFIGLGKLGLPCAEVMSEHYNVLGYDVIPPISCKFPISSNLKSLVESSDLIFIAVPTPHSPEYDGSKPISDLPPKDFDYSIVEEVLSEVNQYANKSQLVILISTVLPGTVRNQLIQHITNTRFIYNPYLIAMGSVKWDMINPECVIIGTEYGKPTDDSQLLIDFYKPLMANDPIYHVGTWDEAESIKIFYNTFISAKLSLVNMIQDVAEKNGNINVDVVTTALKTATQRIVSPRYLTAGMGDAGACHPRDNIALRYLSERLNLGYDLFQTIMYSRDIQAKNIALKLITLSDEHNLPIVIHGKSYKPGIPYEIGSYSLLIGNFIEQEGYKVNYADPLTGDTWHGPAIILIAHNADVTYEYTDVKLDTNKFYFDIKEGSVILDLWRTITDIPGCKIIPYGNTRIE